MAYGGYAKLLSRRKGPYRITSAGFENAKMDEDGIENTILIK